MQEQVSGAARQEQEEEEEQEEEGEEGEDFGQALQELGPATHIIIEDDFLEAAQELRQFFHKNFADPRATHKRRFLWDYW